MKRGSGIKGRDDRSSGIEILIADALAKIKPTDPSDIQSFGPERIGGDRGVSWLVFCSRIKKGESRG